MEDEFAPFPPGNPNEVVRWSLRQTTIQEEEMEQAYDVNLKGHLPYRIENQWGRCLAIFAVRQDAQSYLDALNGQ